ncbi:MAG: hypothetical protein K5790_10490 [Nitrosopumilus sp.]|uniref:hypothetical protein n=1 Tax=Nitrosopumilus sp. TaxID=2024843 RepID=UPI00247B8216|nr:hypothetical protein [Nitrosopumilus sp.]MCV0393698.1 hypothetical protein [Nitrosopumilus sp.]
MGYTDKFTVDVWHKIYPITSDRRNWGGKQSTKTMSKEELDEFILNAIHNDEFSGMHISREFR